MATDILDSADVHISVHQQTSGSRQSGFGKLQLTALCFDLDFYLHCFSGVADSHRRRIVPLHLAINLMNDRTFDFRGRAEANGAPAFNARLVGVADQNFIRFVDFF